MRGEEAIALDQIRDHYYDPSLLPKHLGLTQDGERPREVLDIHDVPIAPKVQVDPPGPDDTRVAIRIEDRGGGIGRVVVLVNGKQVHEYASGTLQARSATGTPIYFDIAGDSRVKPGEINQVQVLAYDAANRLLSKGPMRSVVSSGTKPKEVRHHLWAIVCGVSEYGSPHLRLRYAAADAERFAKALGLAATRMLGEDRVHIRLLAGKAGKQGAWRADREHLLKAFDELKAAGPHDVIVIYLSGHGICGRGQDGDYYYLLATARSTDPADPSAREMDMMASDELFGLIQATAPGVGRQVLILDTCASGRVTERLSSARDASGRQERALMRLKDGLGLFVLTGCAANRVAYEASRYGQGLLTWSLLSGMRSGEALNENREVGVLELFAHAVKTVPMMANAVGAQQIPRICAPEAESTPFPLGLLTLEDQKAIEVNPPRPLIIVGQFGVGRYARDKEKLTSAVADALLQISSRGAEAPFYFVDADEVPDAFELSGSYAVNGDRIHVDFALLRDEDPKAELTADGRTNDIEGLASTIVEKAAAAVARLPKTVR